VLRVQVAQTGDITAHAELLAIREASAKVRSGASGRRPLAGCTAYLVAAPCAMWVIDTDLPGLPDIFFVASSSQWLYDSAGAHFACPLLFASAVPAAQVLCCS
jgi:tRNA(Arg) A34 adenosine deaminase TadA